MPGGCVVGRGAMVPVVGSVAGGAVGAGDRPVVSAGGVVSEQSRYINAAPINTHIAR